MIFIFPIQIQSYRTFLNINELRETLRNEAAQLSINKKIFRISEQKSSYIYARCSACRSVLKFQKNQNGEFKLKLFKNQHNHRSINENQMIQNFIKNLPATIKTSCALKLTLQKFPISKRKFYYHNNKVTFKGNYTFDQIIRKLDEQNYQIRYQPPPTQQQMIPDLILIISPTNKVNFKRFSQFMTFDITYGLIKQVKRIIVGGNQKLLYWGLGVFSGINQNNKIVPFGYCLTNDESAQSMYNIFNNFFQIMGTVPQTIFSDQQKSIQSGLSKLKSNRNLQIEHYLDVYHIFKNLKKKCKNDRLFSKLHDATMTKCAIEFKNIISQCEKIVANVEEHHILENFLKKADKFCYSQIKNSFVGLGISTSPGQKLNDMIKQQIQYQKPISQAISKLNLFFKKIEEKGLLRNFCKIKYQQIFSYHYLGQMRYLLCQKVFMFLLRNYINSLSLRFHQTNELFFQFQDGFIVQKVQNLLRCNCGLYDKSGVACSHQLKIIESSHQDIKKYIHNRWLIVEKNRTSTEDLVFTHLGRPRLSRRNIM